MNSFLLNLLAFGAMLSAILVITAKNPVISVIADSIAPNASRLSRKLFMLKYINCSAGP